MVDQIVKLPPHVKIPEDDQNRNLLRFFVISSLLSFIVIIVLFGAGTYVTFQRYLLGDAEQEAVQIAQALLAREKQILIAENAQGQPIVAMPAGEFSAFDRRVRGMLGVFDVMKIKIFAPDTTIIYSNDYQIIGEQDRENSELKKALAGDIQSKLETKGEFWDLEGEKKYDLDMVETYIPVRDEQGRIAGAFEIYRDISSYNREVLQLAAFSVMIISLVLTVVFVVLFVIMRRATGIIQSKAHEIKVLSGMLPVCSYCKKIRDDKGEWEPMEEYITERSESVFSHSFCPECLRKHYPELYDQEQSQG